MTETQISDFQQSILDYYKKYGRQFPWRNCANPYHVLLSEFMLQQTQTERIRPKYQAFLKTFPTVADLASAEFSSVLECWLGLGYNRRAKFLHQSAKTILADFNGQIPSAPEELVKLPGIGAYTSNAIACFAYNRPTVFIETNIRSVFIFFFFKEEVAINDVAIFPLIKATLYHQNPRLWYYALMDYGATLKKKIINPNRKSSHYTKQSAFAGSIRQARGEVLRILLKEVLTEEQIFQQTTIEKEQIQSALNGLLAEGFVCESEYGYTINE